MHGPRDQAVALHLAQRLREHLLADTLNQFAQAREAQFTLFRQYLKNQQWSTCRLNEQRLEGYYGNTGCGYTDYPFLGGESETDEREEAEAPAKTPTSEASHRPPFPFHPL